MKTENIARIFIGGESLDISDSGLVTKYSRCRVISTFGQSSGNGYLRIDIKGKAIGVHRLVAKAFLDNYSDDLDVDHINGKRQDNRPSNLRMATNSQNQRGFTKQNRGVSAYRGVVKGGRPNRWKSHVRIDGKQKTVGSSFHCEESAALARDAAAYHDGYPLEGLNFPYLFNIQPA